jgi:translation initiation factor IF-2
MQAVCFSSKPPGNFRKEGGSRHFQGRDRINEDTAKPDPLTQYRQRRTETVKRNTAGTTTSQFSRPSERRGINVGGMGNATQKPADKWNDGRKEWPKNQHQMHPKQSKYKTPYSHQKPSNYYIHGRGNDVRLDKQPQLHQKQEQEDPRRNKLDHLLKVLKDSGKTVPSDLPRRTNDRRAPFFQKQNEYLDSRNKDDTQRLSSWNNRSSQQQPPKRRSVERVGVDFLSDSDMRRNKLHEEKETENIRRPVEEKPQKAVTLPSVPLTISEASTLFRIKIGDIKTKLRTMGVLAEEGSDDDEVEADDSAPRSSHPKEEFRLDVDAMELLGLEFGIETIRSDEDVVVNSEQLLMQQRKGDSVAQDDARYPPRPPVVTIMGHVDHGKTTLMDALRRQSQQQHNVKTETKKKTAKKGNPQSQSQDIAGTEAGGITQIISAFEVALRGQDNKITFLDTPGHAAFTAMRHSGTHAADVIVLVVAADDGVSEQTIEIIDLYKSIVKGSSENSISMVVALNKIDKPGINVDEAKRRVENQLLQHGIIAESINTTDSEYGQPVQVIPTSGLTGEGLDDLMEGILLQSEMMNLRADDSANAEGIVMDARMEKGLGVVVDCIIRWGNIKKGDVIISGDQVSRVRMLKDVNDKILKKGLPSQPVRIVGFKSLPKAGDPLMVVESEEAAEQMLEQRLSLGDSESDRPDGQNSDLELHIHGMRRGDTWRVKNFQEMAGLEEADGSVRIPIIVKADADGSLSAVRESLINLGRNSKHVVIVDPLSEGIGDITLGDIQMAKESNATVFAFGLKRIDPAILNLAESEGVQICSSDIIYALLDTAKELLGSYLPPTRKEHIHGRALVKAIFSIDTDSGKEKIAGLKVMDGHIYKARAPLPVDSEDSLSSELRCHFRIFRNGERISPEGETVTASSLRRFKKSVENVRGGDECGLGISGFDGFEEGDEIECYSIEMKRGKL